MNRDHTMKKNSINQTRPVRKPRESDIQGNRTIKKEGTNIQVVLRCKNTTANQPFLSILKPQTPQQQVTKDMLLGDRIYNFDRVFNHETTQEQIYNEIARPILHQVLSGYNCTIFAYGQTGTGKTYTMEGNLEEQKGRFTLNAGIIPRVIESLFDMVDLKNNQENHVMVSMLELYNEELRDLLSPNNVPLKMFDDGTGVTIQNLQEHPLTSALQGVRKMRDGIQRRMTAQTNCNDKSSRSHCIFTLTLYLHEKNAKGEDIYRVGKLNLVDLAGSENSHKSGSEQTRAMEAAQINKSLLALGRVINCLVDGSTHIPYRGSKLTRLLKDSLGGNTKTCIIATIAPTQQTMDEIRSTLDYAVHAKGIYNKPIANTPINRERHLDTLVKTIDQLYEELLINYEQNGVYLSKKQYDQSKLELKTLKDDLQKAKLDISELLVAEHKVREEATRTTELVKQDALKKQEELIKDIHAKNDEISLMKKEMEELVTRFKEKEKKMEIAFKERENALILEQKTKQDKLIEAAQTVRDNYNDSIAKTARFRDELSKMMDERWNVLITDLTSKSVNTPDINSVAIETGSYHLKSENLLPGAAGSTASIAVAPLSAATTTTTTTSVENTVKTNNKLEQNEKISRNGNEDNKISNKKTDRLSQNLNRQMLNNTALGMRTREDSQSIQNKRNRIG